MPYVTEGLYPERVFKHFEDISQIPRSSGNEKRVSDYIYNFARNLGLEAYQDEYYNLIVKKPATNNAVEPETVVLQAHLDMVADSEDQIQHDFDNDPLQLRIVDGKLYATDTTLGADNGIGVAYIMSILESDSIIHPDLVCVFTVNEEAGLLGVNQLNLDSIKADHIINLDTSSEDNILVGCAGSVTSTISIRKEYKPAIPTNIALEINVKGLLGGHSGGYINSHRANANVVMGRLLNAITHKYDMFMINGGSRRNAIPRNAETVISVDPDDIEAIAREIQKVGVKIQKEFYPYDPDLKIELRRSAPLSYKVFTTQCRQKITRMISLMPDGVISMSGDLEGNVETSTNFAIIHETNKSIEFINMTRSCVDSKKDFVKTNLRVLSETIGGKIEYSSEYPAWEYSRSSKLQEKAISLYKDIFEKEADVEVVHSGLECGILLDKLNSRADAISIGPNINECHTPQENVEITSVARVWNYLLALLQNI